MHKLESTNDTSFPRHRFHTVPSAKTDVEACGSYHRLLPAGLSGSCAGSRLATSRILRSVRQREEHRQRRASGRAATLDIDIDAVKAMFDTNVFGPIRVIQACAPLLLSSKTDKKPMVVNIGSTTGSAPSPWQASYASTKVRASDGLVRGGLTPRRHSTYSQTLFVSRRED